MDQSSSDKKCLLFRASIENRSLDVKLIFVKKKELRLPSFDAALPGEKARGAIAHVDNRFSIFEKSILI
jgi:hypothetical protein